MKSSPAPGSGLAPASVWATACTALDADRLPNGNTLITDYSKKEVLEVNAAGEVVWRISTADNAYGAIRLLDGNTVVTFPTAHKAYVYDPEGEIVEKLEELLNVSDIEFLPDGSRIIAGKDYVERRNPDGKPVWKLTMSGWIGSVFLK